MTEKTSRDLLLFLMSIFIFIVTKNKKYINLIYKPNLLYFSHSKEGKELRQVPSSSYYFQLPQEFLNN